MKDTDKDNTEKIEAISGVAGAFCNQELNQYQVVIGQTVEDVFDEVVTQLEDRVVDDEATKDAVESTSGGTGSKNPFAPSFQIIIGIITSSMITIIALLAAGGMINGLANLFSIQAAGSVISLLQSMHTYLTPQILTSNLLQQQPWHHFSSFQFWLFSQL